MQKQSFFERLTGAQQKINDSDGNGAADVQLPGATVAPVHTTAFRESGQWVGSMPRETEAGEDAYEGQLSVDVYQTPTDIVIKTMVAGVKPDEVDISITRDMVTIRGHRAESRAIAEDDYLHRELYWGTFSRTVLLPAEVDPEAAEAISRHGLLIVKLPKLDKDRQTKLTVRPA